jgi:hypothetical protein
MIGKLMMQMIKGFIEILEKLFINLFGYKQNQGKG